jgi:hypothetical protein
MKNICSLFSIIFMIMSFDTKLNSQTLSTVNASAGSRIIVPMTVTEVESLDFGSALKQAGVAGSVILYAGDASRDFAGGVSALSIDSQASNAVFNITGMSETTYALTLPSTITVVEPGSMSMTIDELRISFDKSTQDILLNEISNSVSKVLSSEGTDSFRLGGRLNVDSEQVEGMYSGTYTVTVDYN